MNSTTTQLEDVREYLFRNKKMSQRDATDDLGCVRLPARIKELREELERENSEFIIITEMVDTQNRKGKKIKFGEYQLWNKKDYYLMMIKRLGNEAIKFKEGTERHARAISEQDIYIRKFADFKKKALNSTQPSLFDSPRSTERGLSQVFGAGDVSNH